MRILRYEADVVFTRVDGDRWRVDKHRTLEPGAIVDLANRREMIADLEKAMGHSAAVLTCDGDRVRFQVGDYFVDMPRHESAAESRLSILQLVERIIGG